MHDKGFRLTLIALLLLLPAALPGIQQPEESGELAVGEWLGQAVAGGVTQTGSDPNTIVGTGSFTVDMELLVPISGDLQGSWTMDGNSSSSSWDFSFVAPEAGTIEFGAFMQHSAEGEITGTPSEFSLGSTTINSEITLPTGETLLSSDPVGPIELQVKGIQCNDAWGEWILSWHAELEGQGYTPTFNGNWHAVRQNAAFSKERLNEILDLSTEFNNLLQDTLQSASQLGGVPIVPANALWDLIHQGVDLINTAQNLSVEEEPCFVALLSEGDAGHTYETWSTLITNQVKLIAGVMLDNADVRGETMHPSDVANLCHSLYSVGAIGIGAASVSGGLEDALASELGETLTDPNATTQDKMLAFYEIELWGFDLPEGIDPTDLFPEYEGEE